MSQGYPLSTAVDEPNGAVAAEGSDERVRVLDAARRCCERWGITKVTVDDIAAEAGFSRATLYRLFPGGRDVLFGAMRERNIRQFFTELQAHLASVESLEDLVIGIVTHATRQLRADPHVRLMMASEPGVVARDLGIYGLPRIIAVAASMFGPRLVPFIAADEVHEIAEWLSRLVVSYFLAPSTHVDLGDPVAARAFVRRFVLPAFRVTELTITS